MSNRPSWYDWILQKNRYANQEALQKSDSVEGLEKGKNRAARRAAERSAKEQSLKNSKVHAISHAEAISGTHGYNVHHHDLATGKVTTTWKPQGDTKIRLKNPNATHLVHHEHDRSGTMVSKETAEIVKKRGTFNHHAYLAGGTGAEDPGTIPQKLASSVAESKGEELQKATAREKEGDIPAYSVAHPPKGDFPKGSKCVVSGCSKAPYDKVVFPTMAGPQEGHICKDHAHEAIAQVHGFSDEDKPKKPR
jgi:hypothetical protein